MRKRRWSTRSTTYRTAITLLAMVALAVPTSPAHAAGDVRITSDNGSGEYRRYDGKSDATLRACSDGRRPQNEPSVAVDPRHVDVVVSAANDSCPTAVNGNGWAGYYRSTDAGRTWTMSLVPGYPGDESSAGLASPAHGLCESAFDTTVSFDSAGRVFVGFSCRNRSQPTNFSTLVAVYDDHGARYAATTMVDEGTPSGLDHGVGHDHSNLAVDMVSGAVYLAWARYTGWGWNDFIYFSRSLDHGASFSRPIRVTPGNSWEQFADLAVGPDGVIHLTYREFSFKPAGVDAIWIVTSTDAGLSFGRPRLVAEIAPFDSSQFSGLGIYGQDCGDGPFRCPSGFTFTRFWSFSAVAADANGVHVVWSARTKSGQGKIFVRNSPDGLNWPTAASLVDSVPVGHQYSPDVASADGVITTVFYDSRADPAYAVDIPPGNTREGKNSGGAVDAYAARSEDGGLTWFESRLSTVSSNFGYESFGSRRVPFWGDYIYISAVAGAVQAVWTDSRDLVAGDDPRETGSDDDQDGFDVYQPCTYVPNDIDAEAYSAPLLSDPCLSLGGLDENIYSARVEQGGRST